MSIQPRPADNTTQYNLLLGMPFVEWSPTVGGVAQPYENLGIVESAELAKELESIALESSQSGVRVTVRELPTKINPQLNIGVFNWAASVLRYSVGSATKTVLPAAAAQAVVNEPVVLTADTLDFLDLAHRALNPGSVVVTPAPVVAEAVGTGDGTLGAISGSYALRYKIAAVADIAGTIDVTSAAGVVTSYTPVAVGGSGVGLKVEVVIGTGATSGNLQFFSGAGAINVTGAITASYTPSFVLTEGVSTGADDYLVDWKGGRIQLHHEATKAAGTRPILAGQTVAVDYTYQRAAHTVIAPFTQLSFDGKARLRLLSDVGINLIWEVPSAQILVTSTSIAFSDDNFTVGSLNLKLLDHPTLRFGSIEVYSETEAGA